MQEGDQMLHKLEEHIARGPRYKYLGTPFHISMVCANLKEYEFAWKLEKLYGTNNWPPFHILQFNMEIVCFATWSSKSM